NSIRVDFVWQHIEEDGDNQWKWENYDYLVQAAEQRGIRIFALIGYQWPPNWFPDEWYTMHPPEEDASGIYHSERWASDIINYEHPDARAQYAEWFQNVCSRYKDSKAIVGWIIGNESGYLGLWSGLLDGYDPWCEAAFQDWCETKYTNVAAANAVWGTAFTNFNQLTFPDQYRAYGVDGAIWADAVQWREHSIGSFTALGAVAAKAADTNHLISYSTVGMQWGEEDWRYHAEDRGTITRACENAGAPIDFFSVNNYPWSILGHESQQGHWGISYTKKVTSSTNFPAGVPVLYSETGFTSSETMWPGMDENRQGPLVRNSMWESLEAGAIGTHVFAWHDRPYITDREKGFGILYANRAIKPAFWDTRDFFNLMQQNNVAGLLAGSRDPKPDIAFLWTAAVDSQYNRYECEMQQIAGALERLGFEPNFMNLDDLAAGAHTNYDVVILPRNMRVDRDLPGHTNSVLNYLLTRVIADGVHVIASADLPGRQDQNGNLRPVYTNELDALFGIDAADVGGYEVPARTHDFVGSYMTRIEVTFSNGVGALADTYVTTPKVWRYSDEVLVTDGQVWGTMDTGRNKGFEDSATNLPAWSSWGSVQVSQTSPMEGANHLVMSGEAGIYQEFPAVQHGRYTASAWLRSNSGDPLRNGDEAYVAIEWYDRDWNLLGISESAHLATNTPGDGWVRYQVDALAPTNSWTGRRVIKLTGPGAGTLLVDGKSRAPALVVKDHGTAKAAIFCYTAGDISPDSNNDDEMDVVPWQWRYDIFGALVKDYFGVDPALEVTGTNAYLCLAEYRDCADGSLLMQVKNYMYDRFVTNGGPALTFTIHSSIFTGRTVQSLCEGRIVEQDCDGAFSLTLEPDGMDMIHVYDAAPEPLVQFMDAPSEVHPMGDKAFEVKIAYDCLDETNLVLNLAYMECGDNGDGIPNEIYQQVSTGAVGEGVCTFWIWIPDADGSDPDYISSADGGDYEFAAWIEDAAGQVVAEALPRDVQLKWGLRPINMPSYVFAGGTAGIQVEWENLVEYLPWQNTPMVRNEAFPSRVGVFRSNKTELRGSGHFERANELCDWLESMDYVKGNPLEVLFDNVVVSNLFTDAFTDGIWTDTWTRACGCANWEESGGVLRAWRIGNSDNIIAGGSSSWSNYSVEADIRYATQGPYFNDAEIYVRYQDRDNYYKVGIHNFYEFWRLKYTVKVAGEVVDQDWVCSFSKTNRPVENVWYNLRVDMQGDDCTVYFDGQEVGGFTATNFATGRIALGTRAVQLGIWEPARGYYFIDDDEYNDDGEPVNLDWGYLSQFFNTLILPGVSAMSDIEVANVRAWLTNGLNSLISTDGGVAMYDETGAPDMGRIEDLFGVAPTVSAISGLDELMIGTNDHFVTLDYDPGDIVGLTGDGAAYTTVTNATTLAVAGNGSATRPALICRTIMDNPLAPVKTFCFNFAADTGGQLQGALSELAARAFEWARGQAYRVEFEAAYGEFPITSFSGWILSGNGTNIFYGKIPEQGIMTGSNVNWSMYVYPWDSADPWGDHLGFYTTDNEEFSFEVIGKGLRLLGAPELIYAGRPWGLYAGYNTEGATQQMVFGLQATGGPTDADSLSKTYLEGWTKGGSLASAWTPYTHYTTKETYLSARILESETGSWLIRDGLDVAGRPITVEFDMNSSYYSGLTAGLYYRGVVLRLDRGACGWIDDNPSYESGLDYGWQHVTVNIRPGDPYDRADLYVDGVAIFVDEPIEVDSYTSSALGFFGNSVSTYGYYFYLRHFRVSGPVYGSARKSVIGEHMPTSDAPTVEAWVPDHELAWTGYVSTASGGDYEWFMGLTEAEVYDTLPVEVYFAPRLRVEEPAFPTNLTPGGTYSVPVEWENLPDVPMMLLIALENPYTQDRVAEATFLVHTNTGQGWFDVTLPEYATGGADYMWLALMCDQYAAHPYLQRLGSDDTFRYDAQGIPGAPREVRVVVERLPPDPVSGSAGYSDAGIHPAFNLQTWGGGGSSWNSAYTGDTPPEGTKCFRTVAVSGAGWGAFATNGNWGVHLCGYHSGALVFWVKSASDVRVGVAALGTTNRVSISSYGWTGTATWQEISVPIADFGFTRPQLGRVTCPFMFELPSGTSGTFLIDHVRWVGPPFVLYEDVGIPLDGVIWTWAGSWLGIPFDGNYVGELPPEGVKCFKTDGWSWAGWGVFQTNRQWDLHDYYGGSMHFWVKSDYSLKVECEKSKYVKCYTYLNSQGWVRSNVWQEMSIPLSRLTYGTGAPTYTNLCNMYGAFSITRESAGEFYVDEVHYRLPDISFVVSNTPPGLSALTNISVFEGTLIAFTATVSDVDTPAQTLIFSLDLNTPSGATIDPSTGAFSWTPTEAQGPGEYDVIVRVLDDGNPALGDAVTFTVNVAESNAAPVLSAITNITIEEGSQTSLIVTATDDDLPDQALVFSLVGDVPLGATITGSSGIFHWSPTWDQGGTEYTVTVHVVDTCGAWDEETFTVTVIDWNTPPVLSPIGNKWVLENEPLIFTALVTDADDPPQTLTFSLDGGAPTGASIHATSGQFSWTPSDSQGGSAYGVTIRVNDGHGGEDWESFTITVGETNSAPVISPIPVQSVLIGGSVCFTAAATDVDVPVDDLVFSLGANAPTSAVIDPMTGVFAWTPADSDLSGDRVFQVLCTDDGSPPMTGSCTVVIGVGREPDIPDANVLYSDDGLLPGYELGTWGGGGSSWADAWVGGSPPEGSNCFRLVSVGPAGWGAISGATNGYDLSAYIDEDLVFWVQTTHDVEIGLAAAGVTNRLALSACGWSGTDAWEEVEVPIASFGLSEQELRNVTAAFMVFAPSSTVLVDYVRWEGESVVVFADAGILPGHAVSKSAGGSSYILDASYSGETPPEGTQCLLASNTSYLTWQVVRTNAPFTAKAFTFDGPTAQVKLEGDLLYVISSSNELSIFDVSDPAEPNLVGSLEHGGYRYLRDIDVSGSVVFMADYSDGTMIVDASDPSDPHPVGSIAGQAEWVDVDGSYLYRSTRTAGSAAPGMYIHDISNPSAPVQVGTWMAPLSMVHYWYGELQVQDGFAYVPDYHRGLWIVDVRDPLNPCTASFVSNGGCTAVQVVGHRAYVGGYYGPDLAVLDVSDPWNPETLGTLDGIAYTPHSILVQGDYVFLADDTSLRVVDVTDPENPRLVGSWQSTASNTRSGIAAKGNYVYVPDGGTRLHVVDVSSALNPEDFGRFADGSVSLHVKSLENLMVGAQALGTMRQTYLSGHGWEYGLDTWQHVCVAASNLYYDEEELRHVEIPFRVYRSSVTTNPVFFIDDVQWQMPPLTNACHEVAPVIASIPNTIVAEGSNVSLLVTAADADYPPQTLTFSLDVAPTGAAIDSVTGEFTWPAPLEDTGTLVYAVTVRVTDNGNPPLSDTESFEFRLEEANQAPDLAPIGDEIVTMLGELVLTMSTTDPDWPVQGLTYSLEPGAPFGMTIHPSTGQLRWGPTEAQGPDVYVVGIRVIDDGSPPLSDTETFTIAVIDTNSRPVLAAIGPKSVDEEVPLAFTASATDTDQPPQSLTFTLEGYVPEGAAIDPESGAFTWTPLEIHGGMNHVLRVRVTDSYWAYGQEAVTVTVAEINKAPVLPAIGTLAIGECSPSYVSMAADDTDYPVQTLTYSLDAGTATGAVLNPATGVFTWTPTELQGPGEYGMTITVTDNGEPPLGDTQSITVTVAEVNSPPVIWPLEYQAIDVGETLVFTTRVTDTDVPTQSVSFALLNGIPAGAVVDPVTGVFTWTPTNEADQGYYPVMILAEDDGSPPLSATGKLMITVGDPAADSLDGPCVFYSDAGFHEGFAPATWGGSGSTWEAFFDDSSAPERDTCFQTKARGNAGWSIYRADLAAGQQLGQTPLLAPVHKMVVTNGYAYVVAYTGGLQRFDVSDATNPVAVGTAYTGTVRDLAFDGDDAFIVVTDAGIVRLDVSDPTNVTELGVITNFGFDVRSVDIQGSFLYAGGYGWLGVLDITSPDEPTVVYLNTNAYSRYPFEATICGDVLACVSYTSTYLDVHFFDISTPTNPVKSDYMLTGNAAFLYIVLGTPRGIMQVLDDRLYLALDGALRVLDVSNPYDIKIVGSASVPGARAVTLHGGYAFVAANTGLVTVLDVQAPLQPTKLGTWALPGQNHDLCAANGALHVLQVNALRVLSADVESLPADGLDAMANADASLAFWVQATQNLAVGMTASGITNELDLSTWGWTNDGTWQEIMIPLEAFGFELGDLADVTVPFSVRTLGAADGDFYVDMVRWVEDVFLVYGDAGLPEGCDTWTWDGGTGIFDGFQTNEYVPEGVTCYAATNTSWVGWGVFQTDAVYKAVCQQGGFGSARDMALVEDTLYAVDYDAGLRIFDISNPTNPVLQGTISTTNRPTVVAVDGNYACVGNDSGEIVMVDVGNPSSPVAVGTGSIGRVVSAVALDGDYAYAGVGAYGLRVFDVSDPTNPVIVGVWTSTVSCDVREVACEGRYVYLTDYYAGLRILDVLNPTQPTNVGTLNLSGYEQGLCVKNGRAYVSASSYLFVVDVGNPVSPANLGTLYLSGMVGEGMALKDDRVYLLRSGVTNLCVIDVSEPTVLRKAGLCVAGTNALDVCVDDGTNTWVSMGTNGLSGIDTSAHGQGLDVSAYYGGSLTFWVKTTRDLKVELQSFGVKRTLYISSYGWSGNNWWEKISIPVQAFGFDRRDLRHLEGAFLITADGAASFYVDYVRYEMLDLAYEHGAVNLAPAFVTGMEDQVVSVGAELRFVAAAEDDPTQTLTYSVQGAPPGASIVATNGLFSWTPTSGQAGQAFTISIRVTDNGSPTLYDYQSFVVNVSGEPNAPPVLASIGARAVDEESELVFTASATDTDMPPQELTYSLDFGAPAGASINPTNGAFSWTPPETAGGTSHVLVVRVRDCYWAGDSEVVTVTVAEVNSAPAFGSVPDRTIQEGSELAFAVDAFDTDNPVQTISFSLEPGAPTNATLNASTGDFSWTPSESEGPGMYGVTVRVVDDGTPPMTNTTSFNITVEEDNTAPVLAAIGDRSADEGEIIQITASATDADLPAQNLAFSLDAGAPSGATIDPVSGVFSWTPGEDQGGTNYSVTVRVTDDSTPALDDSETITITVYELNDAPVLGDINVDPVPESTELSFTAAATDGDLPVQTLTYSLDEGAPAGAYINPTNGAFAWTPTEAEGPNMYFVTVRVTDDGSPALDDSEMLTLIVPEVNLAPVLGAIEGRQVLAGRTVDFHASASDADVPANEITFSLGAGAPTNAVIDPASGVFAWVPHGGQTGVWSVAVVATDDGNPILSDTQNVSVTVYDDQTAPLCAYVAPDGGHTYPYTNWTFAATNVADAVGAVADHGTVLITNGAYLLPTEVLLACPVVLEGVNGATHTTLDGGGATRCLRVSHTGVLVRGLSMVGGLSTQGMGGGVLLDGGGRIEACIVRSNTASGVSAWGGGVHSVSGALVNCIVDHNAAAGQTLALGGGVWNEGGLVQNCTIVENQASGATSEGGGLFNTNGTVRNTILYFNTASNSADWAGGGGFESCCAALLSGDGNITNDPQFRALASGDLRLAEGSPCIDAGSAASAPTNDLRGVIRPLDGDGAGGVGYDMGAYEFASTNLDADSDLLSDAQEVLVYFLDPFNPDMDGDGQLDGAEIIAGTDPLDVGSCFTVEIPSGFSGGETIDITWLTVTGRLYTVRSSSDLQVWTDVSGWTDMEPTGPTMTYPAPVPAEGSACYRIVVNKDN
ncbi:MAG: putative Ig domain-containing protein, partial [Kiritimatiellae bacterium]|nr:putative Ig domain-containing protein [Kiritimatiellia bacterium]